MIAILGLIIVAFATMLLILSGQTDRIADMPAGGIAAFVIASLFALYFLTGRDERDDKPPVRNRVAAGLSILTALASAIYVSGRTLNMPGLVGGPVASGNPNPSINGLASVRIRRGDNGLFIAKGRINSAASNLVVDLGSSTIILKSSDAERAGIDLATASFATPLTTAAGETMVAPVRIAKLEVGGIRFDDLEAFVAEPGTINENLLGMNFLTRLSSYEVRGQFATLRQ